ncbi:hypothetical protein BDP27DRAFT_1541747 [Rhodocollybia butyracea]|uniref:Uncharacterized protein n=1 Tax=Rhodocollybia butyracea TaxID=206335 RepID=A0A9P5PNX0_9AGAR|nr:hypothetical protein BDP27DRAFT_1541747 [Rhodocollybia butyracea]
MDTTSETIAPPAHYGSFEELSSLLKAQNPSWNLVPEFCKGSKLVLVKTQDNQVYRINHEKLTELAVGLKEVLKLPDPTNGLLGTEISPIPLPGNPREVAIFLHWIEHPHWIPLDLNEPDLLSLYRFADKWICDSATEWALQHIESLGLRASRMLGLATELGVRRWIEPALRELFNKPMYQLSEQEKNEIGPESASIIANAQLYLMDQRVSRASCPPPMANVGFGEKGCPYYGIHHDKSRCAQAWDLGWRNVGLRLIRREDPLPLSEAMQYIRSHRFDGVTDECRISTIESITPFFEVETNLYQRLVDRLGGLVRMSPYSG